MAELADAPDLGSGGETHGGSSPPSRTSDLSNALCVKTLRHARIGRYTAALEASDLRAGIYFVRMQAKGVNLTRRLVVIE